MTELYKKGIFSLDEISDLIMRRCPGRYKNHDSAYTAVKTTARELGIGDINGKKRNKMIAARDVEKILEALKANQRRIIKRPASIPAPVAVPTKETVTIQRRPTQISIFDDAFDGTGNNAFVEWIEPETTPATDDRAKLEAAAAFYDAWIRFCKVMGNEGDII